MLAYETERTTLRQVSVITGVSMLIMVICAGIAVGLVNGQLIIPGNPSATVTNLQQSFPLFTLGVFCWLVIIICDVILSWSFFIFLKQINTSLSLLGLLFRLMYTAFLGAATFQLVRVMNLLNNTERLSFQTEELASLTMLSMESFQSIWSFGLIIFGFHLFIVGWLTLKALFIPKLLGYLLLVASISYIMVHTMYLFLPSFHSITQTLESILSIPMAIGELGIGMWMLFRGGKQKE
ncbi:DUF4386 domain-containing protein [Aureibacillus halotolerans]|uniref:Uncharacterized protein DUF4386 n=1 Tax=Aureibacillus halotolerans TaxID=1508390 RepID=A0A4R6U3Q3_9BACI|nr:DUF4386 domain-containing protein [Aureibacillus halotolerans]TDQ40661.1 uncharacterized protein DUF4386 [Aureibacillus halotolerans]